MTRVRPISRLSGCTGDILYRSSSQRHLTSSSCQDRKCPMPRRARQPVTDPSGPCPCPPSTPPGRQVRRVYPGFSPPCNPMHFSAKKAVLPVHSQEVAYSTRSGHLAANPGALSDVNYLGWTGHANCRQTLAGEFWRGRKGSGVSKPQARPIVR